MSDQKDPGIKLFGRVIPLAVEAEETARGDQPSELPPPVPEDAAAADEVQHKEKEEKEDIELKVNTPQEEKDNMKVDKPEEEQETEMKIDMQYENKVEEMEVNAPQEMENIGPDKSATLDHKEQKNNAEDKAAPDQKEEHGKPANDESGQDKTLKKPDKILPCPRCNSMDTKFCYYNNYNVNQPRHFCKNCQRVEISRTLHPEALASSSSTPLHAAGRNETVLKFGPEVPFCESMVSALNIEEQNLTNALSAPQGENREDKTCSSSVTSYNGPSENTVEFGKNEAPVYCNGVTPVPQSYLGAPFMYPWNVGWNNVPVMVPGRSMPESASPSEDCSTSSASWINSPMMPPSRLPGPAFPYPIMPPALWGCLSGWPATTWNIPWIRTNGCLSPSSSSNSSCSGNGSPTLGKHSRDSNPLKEEKEKSLWVPKTLRIDDPEEAAKSSIWATLGIKPGDPGTFKPFQSKVENKVQKTDAAPVLQANPAALSRSQSFQESS
ncbi:hypothetical protein PR202_gb26885 [Eleusine coracana subsp. coracana]|uniref:Dof-type domain-containing protein n=1 Tax=Eleusine coracana subsp. coracana TaxID=191504 RepID=A0AAV5FTA1_ELECO|nr:hypothetical protein PR202_gb26885 [Eleusine coracana subsp. coracana]